MCIRELLHRSLCLAIVKNTQAVYRFTQVGHAFNDLSQRGTPVNRKVTYDSLLSRTCTLWQTRLKKLDHVSRQIKLQRVEVLNKGKYG